MGRDGDGECKDFTKGVCFRGASCKYRHGINKIRTQSHSAKTFRAIVAAITNRTTGEAVRLCTRLVRPLKSTIGQVGCLALWCKAWPSDFNSAGVFSRTSATEMMEAANTST